KSSAGIRTPSPISEAVWRFSRRQVRPSPQRPPDDLEGKSGQREGHRGNQHGCEFLTQVVKTDVRQELAELRLNRQVEDSDAGRVFTQGGEAADVVLEESKLREQHQHCARLE